MAVRAHEHARLQANTQTRTREHRRYNFKVNYGGCIEREKSFALSEAGNKGKMLERGMHSFLCPDVRFFFLLCICLFIWCLQVYLKKCGSKSCKSRGEKKLRDNKYSRNSFKNVVN